MFENRKYRPPSKEGAGAAPVPHFDPHKPVLANQFRITRRKSVLDVRFEIIHEKVYVKFGGLRSIWEKNSYYIQNLA